MEQNEYSKEEIDWSYVEFIDNQDVVDLIEKVFMLFIFSLPVLMNLLLLSIPTLLSTFLLLNFTPMKTLYEGKTSPLPFEYQMEGIGVNPALSFS